MTSKQQNGEGIYYYLGNITSHITHVLPLYKELGGTIIVTSEKARQRIESYGAAVIAIDNRPYIWMRPGRRPKRIHEHAIMGAQLKKTYDFLNTHASVVLFYDLFDIQHPEWLQKPKKVFLHHGNGLKPFFTMQPKRMKLLEDYDFIGSLSPYTREKFIQGGVPPEKLIDIGIARTDELAEARQRSAAIRKEVVSSLSLQPTKKIILYAPTFWGDTSLHNVGPEIIRRVPDEYTLIFKPHPQTPIKIVKKYKQIAKRRKNVHIVRDEAGSMSPSSLLVACDLIIADLSSIVLEAILANKPIIFADDDPVANRSSEYDQIREIFTFSEKITPKNIDKLPRIISNALEKNIDEEIWKKVQNRAWFYPTSGAISAIKDEIHRIIST